MSPRAPEASVQPGGPFGALLVIVAVISLVLAAAIGAQPATLPSLTLNYNGVLEVILANGTHIRTSTAPGVVIPAGTYAALVNDDVPDVHNTEHIFHFSGPGVNVTTDLLAGDESSELYVLTLEPNAVYTFRDDRQPSLAPVVFSTSSSGSIGFGSSGGSSGSQTGSGVKSSTTSNTSVVGSAILAFRGTLDAVVGAGKLALTRKGKSVMAASIKAGRYTVAVNDLTARGSFTLQRLGKRPLTLTLTGAAFVGKRSATVALTAAQWVFYSTGGKKNYFIVVA